MTDPVQPTPSVNETPKPKKAEVVHEKSGDFTLVPLPVQSSTIAAMGHHGNQMRVKFHSGDVYEYGNISKELFDSIFDNKESVGKAFNAVRKNPHLYPYRKV